MIELRREAPLLDKFQHTDSEDEAESEDAYADAGKIDEYDAEQLTQEHEPVVYDDSDDEFIVQDDDEQDYSRLLPSQ